MMETNASPAPAAGPAWLAPARRGRWSLLAGLAALTAAAAFYPLESRLGSLVYLGLEATLLIAGAVFAALAGGYSAFALFRMSRAAGPVGAAAPLQALGVIAASALTLFGMFIAFLATAGMTRGRQLRKHGKVLLPPLSNEGDWARLPLESAVPAGVRDAVAARWRENGRTEHASVAAFARLTMDLLALGAPPDLIVAANLDARDEIRHAELCFSLAKALDGKDGGPGPFPETKSARSLPANRTFALAELAVDSLIDGALHEGLSARVIAQLARRCAIPAVRALLLELAADEGRHSAHGWEVVEWCLAEGGAPVAHALRGAVAMLPERPATDLPPAARNGAWEAYGIHGVALEEEQHRLCRASLVKRVAALTDRESVVTLPS